MTADGHVEQPVSAATRLGRRASGTPAAETADTRLGRRQADETGHETRLGRRAEPTVDDGGTQLGRRQPQAMETEPDSEGVIRFGPGVPRSPAASPEWSARPAVKATRRRRPWIGALITVVLVAGVIAWLLTRDADPIQAHAAQVTAASPAACDTTVDVVGTIATNGRPGSVTYQWNRNDGQPTDVLTQSVASGATDTQVHLHWSFSGHGRFAAVATLRVLDPGPASETAGAFTYSCP